METPDKHQPHTLIIFSSARQSGNTAQLVFDTQQQCQSVKRVSLDQLNITPYNYENQYPEDDFYELVEDILAADNLIFASPVYWAGTTANIKALIDRLTELCDVPALKHKGRALKGKRGFYLATSVKDEVSPAYYEFFRHIYAYFDMEFTDQLHINCTDGYQSSEHKQSIMQFSQNLKWDTSPELQA